MANKIVLDQSFDEALKGLKTSGNSSSCYKFMTVIRKHLEWPQHKENILKLQRSGSLKQILQALHSSNLHMIGVGLSILGNSCMDNKSSSEIIFKHNGVSTLNHVLKRYPNEDAVNGRIFRIIGNMCQHRMSDVILELKPQLIGSIVEFIQKYTEDDKLESKFSEATIAMGVRALRQSLNQGTFLQIVKKFNTLKAIGSLLIKCSEEWIVGKKNQYILDNIIKFLLQYSKYKYYPGIMEMRNTPKGDSLVYLSQLLPLAPKKIVKIIMNFIRISQLKSDLPIPEICTNFVKLLQKYPIAKDFKEEYRDYIRCLCFLLEHPANRSTERCKETIPQLIRVLCDLKNPTEKMLESCILIVTALDKCSFHEPLIREQLDCNIIDVLTKKIEWVIGSSETLFYKHKPQRGKRKYSEDFTVSKKKLGMTYSELWNPKTPVSSDDEIDLLDNTSSRMANRCSSPSSSSESEMITSPWSSPGSSPLSNRYQESSMVLPYPDLSDSEDYSPVCSDAEEETEPVEATKEEDHSNMEIEKLSDGDDDNAEDNPKISAFSLKFRFLSQVLSLLKTYSVMQPIPNELCSEPLLMILLKCSNYFELNSVTTEVAVAVICRILQTHDYLIPLMQTEVISSVHSTIRTPHGPSCVKCHQIEHVGRKVLENFSSLAESGRGKGDIANRLILGSVDLKKQLVLAIPYIVRNRSILNSFMLNCGGLDILMKLLLDLPFQEKSIRVLCALAMNTLGICSPQQWTGSRKEKMFVNDYHVADDCKNVVTFILDDNSSVTADRDFLCEKSCFFNSLLKGGFRESNENFVKLHHTDYKALNSLIHFLRSDIDKTEPKDIQLETGTLLEVILLCDRYLLEDLCVFLTECVQQFGLSAKSVPIIYKWALESKTNILRIESIAYALVGECDDSDRFMMFANLLKLGYSEEIVGDIQKLVKRYLTLRDSY